MLILFYVFCLLSIISGILVVSSKNPVHSVLFLILVFCSSAGLLLLLEVEFLAMIFLVVYVGAIAVLFLFVVMMLNIKVLELNDGLFKYLPVSILVGFTFLLEILLIINNGDTYNLVDMNNLVVGPLANNDSDLSRVVYSRPKDSGYFFLLDNMRTVGYFIYTYYALSFWISSLILLVAMIGSIVLTLNQRLIIKRQNIYTQVIRTVEDSIRLTNISLKK